VHALVIGLDVALRADMVRALDALGALLGEVRLIEENGAVYAECDNAAERLLLAVRGVSLGRVAGVRYAKWNHWKIKGDPFASRSFVRVRCALTRRWTNSNDAHALRRDMGHCEILTLAGAAMAHRPGFGEDLLAESPTSCGGSLSQLRTELVCWDARLERGVQARHAELPAKYREHRYLEHCSA
jgi:hypothetical protein